MPQSRCRNGHVCFTGQRTRCPECGAALEPLRGADLTALPVPGMELELPRRAPAALDPIAAEPRGASGPVCGWLVCIAGAERGRDFRLACEGNFIGRAPENDVVIASDMYISRVRHATIFYDVAERRFVLSAGPLTRKPVHHNGRAIHSPVDLKAGDVVGVGRTKLLFVPLCPDLHDWAGAAGPDV